MANSKTNDRLGKLTKLMEKATRVEGNYRAIRQELRLDRNVKEYNWISGVQTVLNKGNLTDRQIKWWTTYVNNKLQPYYRLNNKSMQLKLFREQVVGMRMSQRFKAIFETNSYEELGFQEEGLIASYAYDYMTNMNLTPSQKDYQVTRINAMLREAGEDIIPKAIWKTVIKQKVKGV